MITPQIPKNELQRLEALHNLHILDTSSEERFDRITRVTHNLFNVPIVSVSLIDKEREWFKSKYGLEFKETPREISFGAHTILQEGIMIVNDALNDERFKDNPLVTGKPGIRFYLGCPIKIRGQFNIGTLCLLDYKSQQFNKFDLNIIKNLAINIEEEFELKNLSTIDELTNLSNKQGFVIMGKQIIKRCNQFDKNVLLLYFDLNKFKFNNDYNLDQGNKIIKLFSKQLLKNFRKTDAIARLGRDHFCVLCPGMNKAQLPNVIERFQKSLSGIKKEYFIELNIGSIQYDRWRHQSIHSLIEEIEENIYKQQRNAH